MVVRRKNWSGVGAELVTGEDHGPGVARLQWFLDGLLHEEDRAADVAFFRNGRIRLERWLRYGVLHREDGPAVTSYNSAGRILYEAHYRLGLLHRLDGPARIRATGQGQWVKEHFFEGRRIGIVGLAREMYYQTDVSGQEIAPYPYFAALPYNKRKAFMPMLREAMKDVWPGGIPWGEAHEFVFALDPCPFQNEVEFDNFRTNFNRADPTAGPAKGVVLLYWLYAGSTAASNATRTWVDSCLRAGFDTTLEALEERAKDRNESSSEFWQLRSGRSWFGNELWHSFGLYDYGQGGSSTVGSVAVYVDLFGQPLRLPPELTVSTSIMVLTANLTKLPDGSVSFPDVPKTLLEPNGSLVRKGSAKKPFWEVSPGEDFFNATYMPKDGVPIFSVAPQGEGGEFSATLEIPIVGIRVDGPDGLDRNIEAILQALYVKPIDDASRKRGTIVVSRQKYGIQKKAWLTTLHLPVSTRTRCVAFLARRVPPSRVSPS